VISKLVEKPILNVEKLKSKKSGLRVKKALLLPSMRFFVIKREKTEKARREKAYFLFSFVQHSIV